MAHGTAWCPISKGIVLGNFEYNAEVNPHIGSPGVTTMHGEAQSSDATPLPGPGKGPWNVTKIPLGGACPTVLAGQDGIIQVLCTQVAAEGQFLVPKVVTISPTGQELAHLNLPKGALLGGVYAYLDAQDRMVLVDGTNTLLRVAHSEDGRTLSVDSRVDLKDFLSQIPGDQVVVLVPDWQGRVWVASKNAVVAVVDTERGTIRSLRLNMISPSERVDNSISACPSGASVVTSHGIYMLSAANTSQPGI